MNVFSSAFVVALGAETAVRLWLGSRQIAAVRAHRSEVPAAFAGEIALVEQQKAADYTVARAMLSRWVMLVEAISKAVLTVGGGLALIERALSHVDFGEPWRGMVLILCVFGLLGVLGLPFSVWRTFRLEARFGFNRISPALFVVDGIKGLALSLFLGIPLLYAILSLMQRAGTAWWVWAWSLWLVTSVALTWAAPRFIAPLFNRFTAITDPALKDRIGALLERCGFAAGGGVFMMDGSRRSAHGNAYFTGIGRNKRIVFFDTLLARMEIAEVEAVLAHELGHFRLRHVRQRLITSMLGSLLGFALLGWLATQPGFYTAFGVPVTAATALLLFFLTLPAFSFFATPFAAWWSRRQELAADEFAAAHASAANLIAALIKLYRDNATTLTPDALHSAFYDSHPPAVERIRKLREFAH